VHSRRRKTLFDIDTGRRKWWWCPPGAPGPSIDMGWGLIAAVVMEECIHFLEGGRRALSRWTLIL